MSAIVNPSPAPQQTPLRVPPVTAPPEPGKHSRKLWWILGLVAAIAITAYLLRPKPEQQQKIQTVTVKTATIAPTALRQTMRLAGVTSAKNFASIVAPMMRGPDAGRSLVLIYLVKSGSYVKKDEVIAQIDAQSIKDHVDDIESSVQQANGDIRKRQAEQAIEMENLRQQLRVASADLSKAKLEAGASEIRTSIDVELLKIAVEEAEAQVKQLQQDIKTKAIVHQAEVKILGFTRDRHARHRDRHKIDITKFTIRAPMNGLAVMNSKFRGGDMGQIQEGDQVSPGEPFMKVVDPASMQLDANANQAESEELRLNLKAQITFDAFLGLELPGKVVSVGALAAGGWRVNYYVRAVPVRLAILGQDNRVIPDLSAGADIVLREKENALAVPLEAIDTQNGKTVVYVKNGEGFETREVKLGVRTNTHAEVLDGLKAGTEIALSRPAKAAA